MRWTVITISAVALVGAVFVGPARAAKSKMGCEIGSEIWDASQGKCVPGKHVKKSMKKSKKDG
jgi:acetyl/propionyl-CoA carboxylase alpha subunit